MKCCIKNAAFQMDFALSILSHAIFKLILCVISAYVYVQRDMTDPVV